jgi:hypothetical protein
MANMFNTTMILLPSFIAVFATIKTMRLIKKNLILTREIKKISLKLRKPQRHDVDIPIPGNSQEFHESLATAEITTQLQQPRLNIENNRHTAAPSTVSEKYGFIESLSQKGMDPKEIASALSLSIHEVQQVMTLSSLTRSDTPNFA